MSKSRFSGVDEYGFERPTNFDYKAYEDFISNYLEVLTRRARKWSKLIGAKRSVNRNNKIKRYIRKGIPMKYRTMVWMFVSNAQHHCDSCPNYYERLLEGKMNREVVELIKIDVPRTFPENVYFRDYTEGNLDKLYNVLTAFAHHNSSIGYCQGLNYIAGLLLIITKDEEKAFWLLCTLIEENLPGYYDSEMLGIITDIRVLESIIRKRAPLIWKHLKHNGVELELVTTKWFVCLFVETLPVETVLRVWDCLFYEGNKMLMRVAVTLILSNQEKILMSQDFTSLIQCFKEITSSTQVLNCHSFMEQVYLVSGVLPKAQLNKLREKCQEDVLIERDSYKKS